MSEFQNRPLVRDVDDSRRINVASPRALKISVTNARQVAPVLSTGGNTLLIFSGLIRFGQDGDTIGEDPRNEDNSYAELSGLSNDSPRTVMLQLRGPTVADSQFTGAGAFAALADVCLTTNDSFGVVVANGSARLMQPVEDGNQLARDLWFLSDLAAERASADDTSQINRMAYQASVLVALK